MKLFKSKAYSSSWPIIKRHLRTTLPYLNFTRAWNIMVALAEKSLGRVKVKARPYFIKIEPTNLCNLRCKGCLHATDRQDLEKSGYLGSMDFELFKKIIAENEKYLVKVSLYSLGEPLVYPRIADMVAHLNARQIGTVISSNLNYLPEETARRLVENKLTHLIVSLDGAGQESYKKYRDGGDFHKVIENIRLIQAEKKKQYSRYPLLEIQTVKLPHISEEEIKKIGALADELGADKFTVKENVTPYHDNPQPEAGRCFWLYSSPSYQWNGVVQPCCYFYEFANNNFGNASRETTAAIWNNEKYEAAREYFKTGKKKDMDLKCYDCIFFKNKGEESE